MQICLTNTGKRFNREWIFRHCHLEFDTGKSYAITGPNGSGKSTLLQVIAGATQHNEGTVEYRSSQPSSGKQPQPIDATDFYRYIAIAAPYLELIEEMTAGEMLDFHTSFKPFFAGITHRDILSEVGLEKAVDKQIRYFSSGMKQRLKLALAFFSDTPVLLLDEPTTNLDADGIAVYLKLVEGQTNNKLVIVSSNVEQEYEFCEEIIKIETYK